MASTPTRGWAAYARDVIHAYLSGADPTSVPPPLSHAEHSGVFVTLRKFRRLRGCIGSLDASATLADAVRDAAIGAATGDPRFPPVALGELSDLSIEVSVLSAPCPMRSIDELDLETHGVIVRLGNRRGLFLPRVAIDHGLSKTELLERLCTEKAGLPADAWREPACEVLLFTAAKHLE